MPAATFDEAPGIEGRESARRNRDRHEHRQPQQLPETARLLTREKVWQQTADECPAKERLPMASTVNGHGAERHGDHQHHSDRGHDDRNRLDADECR